MLDSVITAFVFGVGIFVGCIIYVVISEELKDKKEKKNGNGK